MKKYVVLPLDGYKTSVEVIRAAHNTLSEPGMADLVGMLKINDAAHMPDLSGPGMVDALYRLIRSLGEENKSFQNVGVFLDLKVGDVSGTLDNVARHYSQPAILTVSALVSGEGFCKLRRALPKTKLALFSVPTDISPEDCQKRWGMFPGKKILHDIDCIEKEYARKRADSDPLLPFDLVVSSPLELSELYINVGADRRYGFVTPGIRDEWMTKGQQERTTGVRYALEHGSRWVVMGAQLRDGNPAKGINPEMSRKMTIKEIKAAKIK